MADEITLDAPETRLERFLAAAAGMDGITLDEPVTRIEKYLYKIAQGSGGVPAVEDADKGKYLHANESTGDLEWEAAGGSGGGVLVVGATFEGNTITLDKTWQEIKDANAAIICIDDDDDHRSFAYIGGVYYNVATGYGVAAFMLGGGSGEWYVDGVEFEADSASDYPSATMG